MAFEVREPGVFHVTYATETDMDPAAQERLLKALEAELTRGPVGLVFQVASALVPHAVPEFWLGVTKRLAPRLCAMAIVSPSLAVRTAASGFSVANALRGVAVAVKAFGPTDGAAALGWVRALRAAQKKP